MKKKMAEFLKSEECPVFSIMLDESTSCANKSCLIVYVRVHTGNSIRNHLVDVTDLESQTAEGLFDKL